MNGEGESPTAMRTLADAMARETSTNTPQAAPHAPMDEMVRTLHELRVHQIELEMQNEELRQSKDALELSQTRFRDLYDLAPVGYFTVNDESRIVQANVCGATLLGLTRAALLKKRMDSFVLPEDRDTLHFLKRQLGQSGALQVRELRMVRQDGTQLWVHLAATAAEDAHGAQEMRLVLTDISAHRAAEESLQITAAKNKALISVIPDLIFTNHRNGQYLAVEASNPGLLFVPPDAFLHRTVTEVLPPPIAQRFLATFAQALDSRCMQEVNYSLPIGADEMYFEARVAPLTADTVVTIVRDITGRKHAENELRIAAIAFESQEGMFVTDANAVILRVNRAFTVITGYSAADAVGRKPDLLSSGRHGAGFYEALYKGLERNGVWQGEVWNRRKSGDVFPEFLSITAVRSEQNTLTHYVATLTDITERKAAEEKITQLAYYDSLTNLPNRRLLLDRLDKALAASSRHGREGALLFVDLDRFKLVNDTLGHDMGDLLLQQVARRMQACVREGDTVARLGGDEFVVMLEDLSASPQDAATQAKAVGEKMLAALEQAYMLDGQSYGCTSSIGVTLFAQRHGTVDELLKRADVAMFQAKNEGRNTLRFFDPVMQAAVDARAVLEKELGVAVRDNHLRLYYQPQMNGDNTLVGAEALVRWEHPHRGLIAPIHFIGLAEETGLIVPLGLWVLETACQQLSAWAEDSAMAHLTLAVNVSARQFNQPDFVEQVLSVLARTGARARQLKLELTESLLVSNVEDVIAKMVALKGHGVGFSLDDFGTGYSSLSYLKRLPLDQLKIDQGFVSNILHDPNDAAIARMVIALSQSMGLSVLAEGVESEAQRAFLAGIGCHVCQGYLFARPLPLADFEAYARQH